MNATTPNRAEMRMMNNDEIKKRAKVKVNIRRDLNPDISIYEYYLDQAIIEARASERAKVVELLAANHLVQGDALWMKAVQQDTINKCIAELEKLKDASEVSVGEANGIDMAISALEEMESEPR